MAEPGAPRPTDLERSIGRPHPLGPLFVRVAAHNPARARAWAAAVLLLAIAMLGTARWVKPDPRGLGTHEQLGLAPCMPVALFGYPCPTCGMTTAFSLAVRGRFLSAFHTQPAGFLLALTTVGTVGVALSVFFTGHVVAINWFRLTPGRVGFAAVGLIILGWAYKIIIGLSSGILPYGNH